MSIDKLFKMDTVMEKEGIIIDYGDFRVRIARAGGSNQKFSKVFQAKMKPLRRQIDTDTLDEKVAARVMAEAYAEAVILDMDILQKDGTYKSGIKVTDDGKPLPVTKENVVKVLVDYPEFFRDLQNQANQVGLYRTAALEEDVKN